MRQFLAVVASVLVMFQGTAYMQGRKTLDVYEIDVEGGQSTLFVSPSGESLLVDAGSPGERDAGRIVDTAKQAGLTQLDYLLVTHYDGDHVGGVKDVSDRITVKNFVDYGTRLKPPAAPAPTEQQQANQDRATAAYLDVVARGNHILVKPGDTLPIKGLDVQIVSGAQHVITKPLPGAGAPNPLCRDYVGHPVDTTENINSLGLVIGAFGRFRMLDLGDLTWNLEHDLACPNNLIGTIDVYLTTHHGLARSGAPALVEAIAPRAVLINNGPRKGSSVETWDTLRKTKSVQDIWELHYSVERPASANFEEKADPGGPGFNSPEDFIANLEPATPPAAPVAPSPAAGAPGRGTPVPAHSPAYFLKVSVQPDGSFSVTNSRNGFSKKYKAGAKR
jgi:beta-lactamase superfamily II metal-dependent hydrolase